MSTEKFLLYRKFLLTLIVAWLIGIVFGLPLVRGQAQSQPNLLTLKVSLWPEYDRPSMLVIYRATLSPETLPVNLVFRIPPAAQPFVVAVGETPTTVDEVSFTQKMVGQWKEIAFPVTFPAVQFEYYDEGMRFEDQARHYEYIWPGDYPVGTMTIEVQKPIGATEVSISPPMGIAEPGQDGLDYYTSQISSVAAGQTLKIILDYQKSDEMLTAKALQIQPSQPITINTPGRNRLRSVLIAALAFLGVALIVGGGWWYWQSGRKESHPERRRRSRAIRQPLAEAESGASVYCHQCGNRAGPGDRYCRSCGTRLRLE